MKWGPVVDVASVRGLSTEGVTRTVEMLSVRDLPVG